MLHVEQQKLNIKKGFVYNLDNFSIKSESAMATNLQTGISELLGQVN